jgi:hypothetical protein
MTVEQATLIIDALQSLVTALWAIAIILLFKKKS